MIKIVLLAFHNITHGASIDYMYLPYWLRECIGYVYMNKCVYEQICTKYISTIHNILGHPSLLVIMVYELWYINTLHNLVSCRYEKQKDSFAGNFRSEVGNHPRSTLPFVTTNILSRKEMSSVCTSGDFLLFNTVSNFSCYWMLYNIHDNNILACSRFNLNKKHSPVCLKIVGTDFACIFSVGEHSIEPFGVMHDYTKAILITLLLLYLCKLHHIRLLFDVVMESHFTIQQNSKCNLFDINTWLPGLRCPALRIHGSQTSTALIDFCLLAEHRDY